MLLLYAVSSEKTEINLLKDGRVAADIRGCSQHFGVVAVVQMSKSFDSPLAAYVRGCVALWNSIDVGAMLCPRDDSTASIEPLHHNIGRVEPIAPWSEVKYSRRRVSIVIYFLHLGLCHTCALLTRVADFAGRQTRARASRRSSGELRRAPIND